MKGFHVKTLAPRGNNEDEAANAAANSEGNPVEGGEAGANAEDGETAAAAQTGGDQASGESNYFKENLRLLQQL